MQAWMDQHKDEEVLSAWTHKWPHLPFINYKIKKKKNKKSNLKNVALKTETADSNQTVNV